MSLPLYLLMPFVAAFVFALSNVLQKRAFQEGASVLAAFALNNLFLGIAFLPALAWATEPVPWGRVWEPIVTGLAFFGGSITGLFALRLGDVSLVTPLLGTKVVLVATISALIFRVPLLPAQIVAAVLTTLGVFILGATDWRPGRRLGLTTALTLLCSSCFAVCDTLIQQWAAGFGVWNFVPLLFATLAIQGVCVVGWQGRTIWRMPRSAWRWLVPAGLLTVVQAVLISASIGLWKDATGVNVVYALRGLWGLVLVWAVGHWFGNTERHEAGPRAMGFRLIGAVLILAAVVLAILAGARRVS